MSKTKIVVVKLKELLLTAALVLLGITLLFLAIALIASKETTPKKLTPAGVSGTETSARYYPGVYTSTLELGDTMIHLELVCDSNHINSVRLIHLDEAVETMYPLLNPALSDLELQLSRDVPLEELTFTEGSTYTQTLLVEAIEKTLAKAEIEP